MSNLTVQSPNFLANGGLPPSNAIVLTSDPTAARAAVSAFMPNEQIRPYSINYTLSVQRSLGNDYTVRSALSWNQRRSSVRAGSDQPCQPRHANL